MSRFERNHVSVWQLVARGSITTNVERPLQTSARSSTETRAHNNVNACNYVQQKQQLRQYGGANPNNVPCCLICCLFVVVVVVSTVVSYQSDRAMTPLAQC